MVNSVSARPAICASCLQIASWAHCCENVCSVCAAPPFSGSLFSATFATTPMLTSSKVTIMPYIKRKSWLYSVCDSSTMTGDSPSIGVCSSPIGARRKSVSAAGCLKAAQCTTRQLSLDRSTRQSAKQPVAPAGSGLYFNKFCAFRIVKPLSFRYGYSIGTDQAATRRSCCAML